MKGRQDRSNGGWAPCIMAMMALIAAGLAVGVRSERALAADGSHGSSEARAAQTPAPTDGRPIFNRACGRCHPNGGEDVGPSILNKNLTEAKVLKQIREGVGRMRPINTTKLPDANLPALMAYLRSIHTVQ